MCGQLDWDRQLIVNDHQVVHLQTIGKSLKKGMNEDRQKVNLRSIVQYESYQKIQLLEL